MAVAEPTVGNSVGTPRRCLNCFIFLLYPVSHHHDERDTLDIQSGPLRPVRAKNTMSRNQMIFSAFRDIVALPDPVCKLLTLRL
jgi:hypothetical protein